MEIKMQCPCFMKLNMTKGEQNLTIGSKHSTRGSGESLTFPNRCGILFNTSVRHRMGLITALGDCRGSWSCLQRGVRIASEDKEKG